jgi:hypothetical protein
MAAAVHPTLILLVLAHFARTQTPLVEFPHPHPHAEKALPPFDEKCVVYGIYYSEKHVRIYGHFPQVELDVGGSRVIRFCQIPIADFDLGSNMFGERWRMAVTLFYVRKHADLISDALVETVSRYSESMI